MKPDELAHRYLEHDLTALEGESFADSLATTNGVDAFRDVLLLETLGRELEQTAPNPGVVVHWKKQAIIAGLLTSIPVAVALLLIGPMPSEIGQQMSTTQGGTEPSWLLSEHPTLATLVAPDDPVFATTLALEIPLLVESIVVPVPWQDTEQSPWRLSLDWNSP